MTSVKKIHNLHSLNRAIRDLKGEVESQERQVEAGLTWARTHLFSVLVRQVFNARKKASDNEEAPGWRKWADLLAGGLAGPAADILETWLRRRRRRNRDR